MLLLMQRVFIDHSVNAHSTGDASTQSQRTVYTRLTAVHLALPHMIEPAATASTNSRHKMQNPEIIAKAHLCQCKHLILQRHPHVMTAEALQRPHVCALCHCCGFGCWSPCDDRWCSVGGHTVVCALLQQSLLAEGSGRSLALRRRQAGAGHSTKAYTSYTQILWNTLS